MYLLLLSLIGSLAGLFLAANDSEHKTEYLTFAALPAMLTSAAATVLVISFRNQPSACVPVLGAARAFVGLAFLVQVVASVYLIVADMTISESIRMIVIWTIVICTGIIVIGAIRSYGMSGIHNDATTSFPQ